MADNLFKTGEELRQAQFAKLIAQSQGGFDSLKATSPLQAGLGELGAGIGAGLGLKLASGDTTEAAGDIDLSGHDLGTAKGLFGAAESMRASGFEQEAQSLEDRGIKISKHERAMSAADTAGNLTDARPLTKLDLAVVNDAWLTRPATAEIVQDINEDAEDNPVAKAGINYLNASIVRNVNEMSRDLEDTHNLSVPTQMLLDTFMDQIEASKVIGEEGFAFWKSPVVDIGKGRKVINSARQATMKFLTETPPKTDDAPIETAPATRTTGEGAIEAPLPAGTERAPAFTRDQQGQVVDQGGRDPGTPLESFVPAAEELEQPPPKMSKWQSDKIKDIDKLLEKHKFQPVVIDSLLRQRQFIFDNFNKKSNK